MNATYVEFSIESPSLSMLISILLHSSLPLCTSLHYFELCQYHIHDYLLKNLDLHWGLGVEVSAISLATLSTYAGIPTILGGDLIDVNILQHTKNLTFRCRI
jgi:hypothetical protein